VIVTWVPAPILIGSSSDHHQEDHCVGQVVEMRKLAARLRAAAPDLDRIASVADSGIDLHEQGGRQDVAGEQVEIIRWDIEVRRHHRHEIAARLSAYKCRGLCRMAGTVASCMGDGPNG